MKNDRAYTRQAVDAWILSFLNRKEVLEPSMSLRDLGILGDDLMEFLEEYSTRFNVDMSSYVWYFHDKGEGWNPGSVLYKRPDQQVEYIPITISMLYDSANQGNWSVIYPKHAISCKRYDLIFNRIIGMALLVIILLYIIVQYLLDNFGSSGK